MRVFFVQNPALAELELNPNPVVLDSEVLTVPEPVSLGAVPRIILPMRPYYIDPGIPVAEALSYYPFPSVPARLSRKFSVNYSSPSELTMAVLYGDEALAGIYIDPTPVSGESKIYRIYTASASVVEGHQEYYASRTADLFMKVYRHVIVDNNSHLRHEVLQTDLPLFDVYSSLLARA